ncbi:uncharacterized protein LOC131161509 isoform X2 [Malania oleifera]|uniref:uncharacterized protein LOC131161509 isoform X2 n=1 Tax=Malania oleifera TaxID=397392 RepID=UPI0025AEA237|nr:uncharacterized protein LOC131161509 isoform X2 [Malania oleifera]
MAAQICVRLSLGHIPSLSLSRRKLKYTALKARALKIRAVASFGSQNQTGGGLLLPQGNSSENIQEKSTTKKRVFFLDVNPLCYEGSTPSLRSFAHWISLFFSDVSHSDPVIAVVDGERGNEYRRQLLPSYKAHRRKFSGQLSTSRRFSRGPARRSHRLISDVLKKCNVPVLKVEDHEADDVVATLVGQVLRRGYRVVIASPDKDFMQLISKDVQIVMPIAELDRWSFYTVKHYRAQYSCHPHFDLSLRSIIGDEVDGVPGIQQVVPGFGRKTAVKLLKRHGSLENLLGAAAVRTVGRPYAQDALTMHADFLRRNYEVLALRRDIDVHLQEEWLSERDAHNDSVILLNFVKWLEESNKLNKKSGSHTSNLCV